MRYRNRNYRNSLFPNNYGPMARLPDFEGAGDLRQSRGTAFVRRRRRAELALSKATVSKAVSRLEARLGARLFNRTSRRLALTDAGRKLAGARRAPARRWRGGGKRGAGAIDGAARAGAAGGADDVRGQGTSRRCCRNSWSSIPRSAIDLHLSDAMVDLIGEGFDAGLRIARLPDSSLVARRLCAMPRYTVAAPAYLEASMAGRRIRCISPSIDASPTPISPRPNVWHYTNQPANRSACGRRVSCGSTMARR